MSYRTVKISAGVGGWGGSLTVTPTPQRTVVASITGGGVHPVAQRIAELTGAEAVDAFNHHVRYDDMVCAVIDCGGTARVGIYPMKNVPTVDVHPVAPGGPLARHVKADNFVSGVGLDEVEGA
ncbi:hypothetical protein ER308_06700 [Egibacter rhizosphaerae]|uniref:PTS EIIB type-5 domain-containing protein n=1 Tax=Egibacter rhizosphaerae TaxID=1670831 RepID=A0A411YDH2_9ACTN|nr:hypothetical protein [Egibacter rhizosphaerae]QBI19261.1 hypothetical protein ER308_06700 [Egibacter rhizosphaerae]